MMQQLLLSTEQNPQMYWQEIVLICSKLGELASSKFFEPELTATEWDFMRANSFTLLQKLETIYHYEEQRKHFGATHEEKRIPQMSEKEKNIFEELIDFDPLFDKFDICWPELDSICILPCEEKAKQQVHHNPVNPSIVRTVKAGENNNVVVKPEPNSPPAASNSNFVPDKKKNGEKQIKIIEIPSDLSAIKKRRHKNLNYDISCQFCHTRDSPEWRNGPLGKRTLCNACGIQYAKKMKKKKLTPKNFSQVVS